MLYNYILKGKRYWQKKKKSLKTKGLTEVISSRHDNSNTRMIDY